MVGPEAIAGSTRLKAGTATKMALNMLSTATMVRLGKVYNNLMVDLRVANRKLAERAVHILTHVSSVDDARARALLEETGWKLKPAIVMAALDLSFDQAQHRLAAAEGALARVIGPDASVAGGRAGAPTAGHAGGDGAR